MPIGSDTGEVFPSKRRSIIRKKNAAIRNLIKTYRSGLHGLHVFAHFIMKYEYSWCNMSRASATQERTEPTELTAHCGTCVLKTAN